MTALEQERSLLEAVDAFNKILDFIKENACMSEANDMEKALFKKVMDLGRIFMKGFFEEKGTGDMGEAVQTTDGTVYKRESGPRTCRYLSVFGLIAVVRAYYRAIEESPSSPPSIFPLDIAANLPERSYSYFVQEIVARLCADSPYRDASEDLKVLFNLNLKPSRLEAIVADKSKHYDDFYPMELHRMDLSEEERKEGEVMVASFDGKGVPMTKAESAKLKAKLGKGEKRLKKKESLVGVCYTVDRKERSAEDVAEGLVEPEKFRERCRAEGLEPDDAKAQNVLRTASIIKPKKELMTFVREEAERRDGDHEKPLVVLLDGALGLWKLARSVFQGWKKATFVLDIIHVMTYLWLAANALYGEESVEGRLWVKSRLTAILKGRVGYVMGGMKQTLTKQGLKGPKRKALETAITYFKSHKRWMRYDKYLAAGLPISTGVVESACNSVVKNRMEGNGMRWTLDGAEAILKLRSLRKSGHLSIYSDYYARIENYRLFGEVGEIKPVNISKHAA